MADKVVQALAKKPRQATLSSYEPTFREKASDVLRALLFTDDREGQRKAERLLGVLETTSPVGVATGIDDMREAAGQGDYLNAGLLGAMALAPGPSPKIKAFHGSPHSFDRFSMDKIGTGEGAQAYGYGLYFAENEGVAKGYRDTLSNRDGSGYATAHLNAQNLVSKVGGDAEYAAEVLREQIASLDPSDFNATKLQETLDVITSGKYAEPLPPSGSMYEVNINASPDDFLDWDKPLSEQPKSIQDALAAMDPDTYAPGGNDYDPMEPGSIIYQRLANQKRNYGIDSGRNNLTTLGGAQSAATQDLKGFGIPGIKYLDAGSRGKGDGSRNYVVFDDKLIEIVRKYGIAGASAMLGYNLMDSIDPAQAKQLEQLEQVRKLDSIFGGAR